MDWNEHAPAVIGMEFRPDRYPGFNPVRRRVAAPSDAIAVTMTADVSEAVTSGRVYGAFEGYYGMTVVETYEAGQEVIEASAIETLTFLPTSVSSFRSGGQHYRGWFLPESGHRVASPTELLDIITGVSNGDGDDYILTIPYSTAVGTWTNDPALRFGFTFGSALTGKRILDVALRAEVGMVPWLIQDLDLTGENANAVTGGLAASGNPIRSSDIIRVGSRSATMSGLMDASWGPDVRLDQTITPTQEVVRTTGEFQPVKVNPVVGPEFWTPSAVSSLLGVAGMRLSFDVASVVVSNAELANPDGVVLGLPAIRRVWLEVTVAPEQRQTRDLIRRAGGLWVDWWTVPLSKPSGGTGYNKTAGDGTTWVIRQPRFGTAPIVRRNDEDLRFLVMAVTGDNLPEGWQPIEAVVDGYGNVLVADPDLDADMVWGIRNMVGSAVSVDSQEFVNSTGTTTPLEEHRSHVVTTDAETYDGILAPLRYVAEPGAMIGDTVDPINDLTLELRKDSDDSLVASATVTTAAVPGLAATLADVFAGFEWRVVQAMFDNPVVLDATTGYYVKPVHTPGGGVLWVWPIVQSEPSPAPSGIGTYLDETAFYEVVGEDPARFDREASFLLFAIPDPITDLTVTPDTYAMPEHTGCGGAVVPILRLSWTPPATSVFSHYEIQRSDNGDDGWVTIFRITNPTVDAAIDEEARRGRAAFYRIRQVNQVGISSEWTAGTGVCPVGTDGLTFTGNALPLRGVAYPDVYRDRGAVRDYEHPVETEFVPIYGRDDVVAFKSLSERGPAFDRRLVVAFAPDVDSVEVFAELIGFTRQALSYITVRDENGDRWFANVDVLRTEVTEPAGLYTAEVAIRQTARVPTPADVFPGS